MCRQLHASITRLSKRDIPSSGKWTWPRSGCAARISSPPGRGRPRGQTGGEREAGTCERGAHLAHLAHPSFPGNAPPPALTKDQDVLAGRQLGPSAGGHLAQDRGPVGTTAERSAPGLDWTRLDLLCPRRPVRLSDGPAQSGRLPARPRPPRPSQLSSAASRSYHRLWPSSSSLVRSPAAATAGPFGPSSSFFSTPTGAILPTAATKRALPRARRGPARTLAGPPAARPAPHLTPPALQGPRRPPRPVGPTMSASSHKTVRPRPWGKVGGGQAAAGTAMRREATAAAGGAARTAGARAASAGQGAQRYPAWCNRPAGLSRCAVGGQEAKWAGAKSSGFGVRPMHDSAIYLALTCVTVTHYLTESYLTLAQMRNLKLGKLKKPAQGPQCPKTASQYFNLTH